MAQRAFAETLRSKMAVQQAMPSTEQKGIESDRTSIPYKTGNVLNPNSRHWNSSIVERYLDEINYKDGNVKVQGSTVEFAIPDDDDLISLTNSYIDAKFFQAIVGVVMKLDDEDELSFLNFIDSVEILSSGKQIEKVEDFSTWAGIWMNYKYGSDFLSSLMGENLGFNDGLTLFDVDQRGGPVFPLWALLGMARTRMLVPKYGFKRLRIRIKLVSDVAYPVQFAVPQAIGTAATPWQWSNFRLLVDTYRTNSVINDLYKAWIDQGQFYFPFKRYIASSAALVAAQQDIYITTSASNVSKVFSVYKLESEINPDEATQATTASNINQVLGEKEYKVTQYSYRMNGQMFPRGGVTTNSQAIAQMISTLGSMGEAWRSNVSKHRFIGHAYFNDATAGRMGALGTSFRRTSFNMRLAGSTDGLNSSARANSLILRLALSDGLARVIYSFVQETVVLKLGSSIKIIY